MLHECSNCKRSLVLVPVRMWALATWKPRQAGGGRAARPDRGGGPALSCLLLRSPPSRPHRRKGPVSLENACDDTVRFSFIKS